MPRKAAPLYLSQRQSGTDYGLYCHGCRREVLTVHLPVGVTVLLALQAAMDKEHRNCQVDPLAPFPELLPKYPCLPR